MIYISGIISLLVQGIVGIIDWLVLKIEVGTNNEFLKDLLKVELFVQFIEFIFYAWLILYFNKVSRNITPYRYLDWSITTPLMLITLSGFLLHDEKKPLEFFTFISDYKDSIIKIILLNGAMLLFGLIGEFGYLNPYISTFLGFIPFVLNFKHIKETFLKSSEDKLKNTLFNWFVFFWSLYGVFALMDYNIKNTGYNILDLFSKNFFGIFLAYFIWYKSKQQTI